MTGNGQTLFRNRKVGLPKHNFGHVDHTTDRDCSLANRPTTFISSTRTRERGRCSSAQSLKGQISNPAAFVNLHSGTSGNPGVIPPIKFALEVDSLPVRNSR